MSALPDVLESARWVVDQAASVTLDAEAARRWARTVTAADFEAHPEPIELAWTGDSQRGANLTLLLDCLNFCFWSGEPWSVEFRGRTWTRTYAMYAGVLRAVEEDPAWLHAEQWVAASLDDLARVFRGQGQIPLLSERLAVLHETGRCLLDPFNGSFLAAVDAAGRDARSLAYLLAERFPSFRDAPAYRSRTIALLKRAQICASDLHQLWRRCGHPGLVGLERLTVFADYRLPQYLRHIGVLVPTDGLAGAIEAGRLIPPGSEPEVELRAATIAGAEMLREALAERGLRVDACRLDYVLWARSHDPEVIIPHHHTRTIYY